MYTIVVAFGIASVMLSLGIILRSKVPFFQNMLMPVSVIGGIIGFIVMNLLLVRIDVCGVTVKDFSDIVEVFFVMSFISIGLTGGGKKKKKETKEVEIDEKTGKKKKGPKQSGLVRGAFGMCLIWCILYAVQPLVGILITTIIGKPFDLQPIYGILVPFAFCQGPGQASTYGKLFERTYGFPHSEMIALSYAAFGFLAAFVIGVPIARYGLRKGLVKNSKPIDDVIKRGYFHKDEKEEYSEPIGHTTYHGGSIDTIAATFAVMGVSYLIALVLSKIVSYIPAIGSSFSAMMFMWGMFGANIAKAVMRKLGIDYLIDDQLQSHITGFFSDYLVTCAFMAIQVSIIGKWLIPILVISTATTAVTFFVTSYFGARLGSDHDFERMLGVYGTSTGTTPSGVSLLRIVDPSLSTDTAAELGIMNGVMILSTPTMIFITLTGLKIVTLPIACAGMFASIFIYLLLLKILGVWQKPTFSFKN